MKTSLLATVLLIFVLASVSYAGPKTGFQAFIAGNAADAQPAPGLSPGLVLMGGGTDVDAAFQWMCQRAGGGDFVVIRTTGTAGKSRRTASTSCRPFMRGISRSVLTTSGAARRMASSASTPCIKSSI